MAKALFFSFPLSGHINPALPLIRELVRRGDEVVCYSTDTFAGRIRETCARYCAYDNAFLADLRRLPDRLYEISSLMMRTTAEVLERQLPAFQAERPDYLIIDSVAPWGKWVAEILNVPAVTSISTFAFNWRVLRFGLKQGARPKSRKEVLYKLWHLVHVGRLRRQLCRRYRVPGPSFMQCLLCQSDLNIVYTSREFQPCSESFDRRFLFVGPSMMARNDGDGFPWDKLRDGPIVYVSLGTLFNNDLAFYRDCMEAFRNEDFQVVMSIGESVSPEALRPFPPNFLVQAHVPQLEVLGRTSAFVTHGGMNSVSESLYNRVPVVVIPQMSEQEIVGRRAEQLGAGICLTKKEVTAEKLRESVHNVLATPRFREGAARVRESFLTSGGVERAADAIIAFTR